MITLIIETDNGTDSKVWLKDDPDQERAVKDYLHTTYSPDTIVKMLDWVEGDDDPEPEFCTVEDLFGLPAKEKC